MHTKIICGWEPLKIGEVVDMVIFDIPQDQEILSKVKPLRVATYEEYKDHYVKEGIPLEHLTPNPPFYYEVQVMD